MMTLKKAQVAYVSDVVRTLSAAYNFPYDAGLALVLTEEESKRGRPEKKVKRVVNKDAEAIIAPMSLPSSPVAEAKAEAQKSAETSEATKAEALVVEVSAPEKKKRAPAKKKVVESKSAMVEDVIMKGLSEVLDEPEPEALVSVVEPIKKKRAPAKKVADTVVLDSKELEAEALLLVEPSAEEKKEDAPIKKKRSPAKKVVAEAVLSDEEDKVKEVVPEKKKRSPAKDKKAEAVLLEVLSDEEEKVSGVEGVLPLENKSEVVTEKKDTLVSPIKKKRGGKKSSVSESESEGEEKPKKAEAEVKKAARSYAPGTGVSAKAEAAPAKKEKKQAEAAKAEAPKEEKEAAPAKKEEKKKAEAAPKEASKNEAQAKKEAPKDAVKVVEEESEYVDETFECDPLNYKGVDYLLGPDNVVYDSEGAEVVGLWDGKNIQFGPDDE